MPAPSVIQHKLGKDGPLVPAMGFGLLPLSIAYGSIPDDEERFKLLDRAVEIGSTFWDSADLYGDSEALLGKWFKRTGKRDQIFLSTKFGYVKGAQLGNIDSSAAYAKSACAESLKILGIDSIDLYWLHRPNRETPIEETMRAMVELKKEGKIKYIGLSEVTSTTLRRAHKIHPVSAIQMEHSPFTLDIEGPEGTDLLATCRELGVAVICYSPLSRGLLTETFTKNEPVTDEKDLRWAAFPRFNENVRDANVKLVNGFKALADKRGCTTSQLALAWLLKQGDDIFPIPGTKRIQYLEENWAALDVKLTDEDELEIRTFVQNNKIAGGRLPEKYNKGLVDTKAES
ncbi:NAD(P)-linked oxidoreductase [Glarea lozoyensis ATCC 20868]|uniref:NAD(P)-linked oxidoreductase n=1 Tax=Glarea lozoyensis (strain ATCC 20868 / MF5171) TaxID=1116229 RepID=S3DD70_GLAL2|nr:NAD(P)-linked oxidoreductase [Glarea lozoyensis ATCC 20868]EPE29941.1 NAD(P)-linked oxidoreductase [Glarea lozoyensis ATCC 20868]